MKKSFEKFKDLVHEFSVTFQLELPTAVDSALRFQYNQILKKNLSDRQKTINNIKSNKCKPLHLLVFYLRL
jgi:hypothetical protein